MDPMIGRQIGRYTITEWLGEGGMAVVYKAHQPSLNRDVAIKILTGMLAHDEEYVDRFRREAVVAGALGHPNILTVHDAGTTDEGQHYIVMEYAPAGTLKERLGRGPLSVADACWMGAQIAGALDAAHRRCIVHRDLKPSNVLLADDGRPLLTDFGVALVTSGTRLTRTGLAIGTPEYMSPEQAQGFAVDARSDVYSLGILLCEMLVGEVPFAADTPLATLYRQVNEAAPRLSALDRRIPEWLADVVACTLAKSPMDRYQSAAAVAGALRGEAEPATRSTSSRIASVQPAPASGPVRPLEARPKGGRRLWPLAVLAAAVTIAAGTYLLALLPASRPTPSTPPVAWLVDQAGTQTAVARAIRTAEAGEAVAAAMTRQAEETLVAGIVTTAVAPPATARAGAAPTAISAPTSTPIRAGVLTPLPSFTIVPYDPADADDVECVICRIPDWEGAYAPGYYQWEVDFPAGERALLAMGWCATDPVTLEQNWARINYQLYADGHAIDMNQVGLFDRDSDGRYCHTYQAVLEGWLPGLHTYGWLQSIAEPLSDGWDVYDAGDYMLEFAVQVGDAVSASDPAPDDVVYEDDFTTVRDPIVANVGEIRWEGGELRILATQPGRTCVAGFMQYVVADFYMQVTARPIRMPADGLYWVAFHVDPQASQTTGYELRLDAEGTCHVHRRIDEESSDTITDHRPCSVAAGQSNLIEIMGAHGMYEISVDGELLFEFSDDAFPAGAVGLAAGNGEQNTGTLVAFDDLYVIEL